MKRTKFQKKLTELEAEISAIFTSDWHLREDTPVCRTDDFWKMQWIKVDFISQLQGKYNCPVIHAGDLFHHWKPSPYLLTMAAKHLPRKFYTIYGQHDLPQHNLDLAEKCGVYNLVHSGVISLLNGTHFGQKASATNVPGINHKLLVWHRMVWHNKLPWPGCKDPNADELFDELPEYDVIVTGDNHKPFSVEYEGRVLVNPGSLTRQKADQHNHKPRIYLYSDTENRVEPIYIPIDENVVSRMHLDESEARNQRLEAFINKLNDDWETDIDFVENMNRFEQSNNIRPSIMKIVREAIES